MRGAVCERLVDRRPLSVMVRGTLERVLGADPLALWSERTAHTLAILFASLYPLGMALIFGTAGLPHIYAPHTSQPWVMVLSGALTAHVSPWPTRRSRARKRWR